MKKLLYIGHEYHNKTKSTGFLVEILKTAFEVDMISLSPYDDTSRIEKTLSQYKNDYDALILFQLFIDPQLIKKHIKYKHAALFPMYDGSPSLNSPEWLNYKDFNIINFSSTLHEGLTKMGLSSYYIQYFPKPANFNRKGDPSRAFFWQRLTDLNLDYVAPILQRLNVKKVHVHKVIDPLHTFVEPKDTTFEIEYSTWYEKKEDILKDIEKAAYYVAPRFFEGIGMSFLEAMAMGRCVIAPNNPTMNEYIKDGITGILYDNPQREIVDFNLEEIQNNTINYIKEGFSAWEKNKAKILDQIEMPVKTDLNKALKWKFASDVALKFYIFKIIPLWKIKKFPNRDIHYLFGFIPLILHKKKSIDTNRESTPKLPLIKIKKY